MVSDSIAVQLVGQAAGETSGTFTTVASQSFNVAFEKARAHQGVEPTTSSLSAVLSPILSLGEQSSQLVSQADPMLSSELRPGELLQITMRSHQFLFHCELVANVANRASDGVQQLFRQQS